MYKFQINFDRTYRQYYNLDSTRHMTLTLLVTVTIHQGPELQCLLKVKKDLS